MGVKESNTQLKYDLINNKNLKLLNVINNFKENNLIINFFNIIYYK